MKKGAERKFGDKARAAFAKVGVLMASARRTRRRCIRRTGRQQGAVPEDTIQSRLPDPDWLEPWLDKQIKFDAEWETKVGERSCTT